MQWQHILISKGRRVWEKVSVMSQSGGKAVGVGEDAQLQRKLSRETENLGRLMNCGSWEKQFGAVAFWLRTSRLRNRLCSSLGSESKVARASGLERFEVYGLCLSAKEKALIEGSRTCHLPALSFQLCFRPAVRLSVNLCLHLSCLFLLQSFLGPALALCLCAAPSTTGRRV